MASAQSEFESMGVQLNKATEDLQSFTSAVAQLKITLEGGGGDSVKGSGTGGNGDVPAKGTRKWLTPDEKDIENYNKAIAKSESLLKSFYDKASAYQSGMARMEMRLTFDSDAERNAFENRNLKDIAGNRAMQVAGVDQKEAIGIQTAALHAGIKQNELSEYSTHVGRFSAATGMAASEVGSVWADVRDKFDLDEQKATLLGDAALHLSKVMDIEAPELMGVLAKSGGMAAKVGMSHQDSAALAGVLLKSGLGSGDASKGMDFLLTLQANSIKDDQSANTLGFKSKAALTGALDSDRAGTLTKILDSLSQLNPTQQKAQLEALFGKSGGALIGRTLKNEKDDQGHFATTGSIFQQTRETVGKEAAYAGSTEKDAHAVEDTAAGKLAHMNGELTRLGTVLGQQLIPYVSVAADVVASVAGRLADVASNHTVLAATVVGVVSFGLALKTVIAGFKVAQGAAKGLAGDVVSLGRSLKRFLPKGGAKDSAKSDAALPSGKSALASASDKTAAAIHRLTVRIAELGRAADGGGYGGDDGGGGGRRKRRRKEKGKRKGEHGHASASGNGRHTGSHSAGRSALTRRRNLSLRWVSGARGLLSSRLALAGGAAVLVSRDSSAADPLMSVGADLLQDQDVMSKVAGSTGKKGSLLTKAAGVMSRESSVLSRVAGSGALKGAGKIAGKLFKPLGLIDDGINLAEGLANGDSHQIGKSAGAAAGGWGGGLAGAAAGAAIGSVVPVVGTAIGGLVGGVLGGMGGSSVGEWVGDKAAGVYDWLTIGGDKGKKQEDEPSGSWLDTAKATMGIFPGVGLAKGGMGFFGGGDRGDKQDRESGSAWLDTVKGMAMQASPLLVDVLPSIGALSSIGGKVASLGSQAWQGISAQGGRLANHVGHLHQGALPDLLSKGLPLKQLFNVLTSTLPPPSTMKASQVLPNPKIWDPQSGASAVIQSGKSQTVQNINVTLHANGDRVQNSQLIDQLMQRLRAELSGPGAPNGAASLNARISAGLTDGASA